MSKYTGRRRADPARPGLPVGWLAAAAGVVLVVATAAVAVAVNSGESDSSSPPSSDAPNTQAKPTDAAKTREPCADAAHIGVPPSYAGSWGSVAAAYEPTASCQAVVIDSAESASVAAGKAEGLSGWIPEDASWLGRAPDIVGQAAKEPTIVARTPLVLVTTAKVADAAGGLRELLAPSVFGSLARATKTFADFGAPELGGLRIAIPDVSTSATGALAFAGLVQVATGRPLTAPPAYVDPSERDLTTIRVEHRIVALSDDAGAIKTLDPTNEKAANVVITTETAALAESQNDDVGFYLGADLQMPLIPLGGDSAAVSAFGDFLTSPAAADVITAAGLRPAAGRATPTAVAGIDPTQYASTTNGATATQVGGIATLFAAMHQRISSLVLLDASGSMLDTLPGSTASKIDLVRRAARNTLEVASPAARSGLMTFRSDDSDHAVIKTPVALAANGSDDGGQLHSARLLAAVEGLKVTGGTPLYDAVREAYGKAVSAYDPQMINQVVLLSDGRNADTEGSISLRQLLASLRSEADPNRPVRIIAIGYGPDADIDALRRIADTTHGRATWLRDDSDYASAVNEALFAG